jgi:fatty acid desaturase
MADAAITTSQSTWSRATAWFWTYEIPSVFMASAVYGAWFLLIWFHAFVPWWLMIPIGGYIIAWQFSFQHEAIHALRRWPKWLRYAICMPPLGLWFPFPAYRRSHSIHHVNMNITVPGKDPETYYVPKDAWQKLSAVSRGVYLFNQTLVGRLAIGPLIRLYKLARREVMRLVNRDYVNVSSWLWHVPLVAALMYFVTEIAGMAWWEYVCLIAYPGFSVGLLRAFYEHRWGERPKQRTAILEASWPMAMLFLWNNLHAVHHLHPTMPWYEIPGYYRQNRDRILKHNGHFLIAGGYLEEVRRWLVKPVFRPIHPKH